MDSSSNMNDINIDHHRSPTSLPRDSTQMAWQMNGPAPVESLRRIPSGGPSRFERWPSWGTEVQIWSLVAPRGEPPGDAKGFAKGFTTG